MQTYVIFNLQNGSSRLFGSKKELILHLKNNYSYELKSDELREFVEEITEINEGECISDEYGMFFIMKPFI